MANLPDVVTVPLLGRFLTKMREFITPAWLGLGNVNNTADSEKYVAFASRAGTADKVKYNLVFRFNGGRTEGTNMWTYDGSTSRSINITADKIGAVAVSQGTANAGKIFYVNNNGEAALIDIATLKTMLDGLA